MGKFRIFILLVRDYISSQIGTNSIFLWFVQAY